MANSNVFPTSPFWGIQNVPKPDPLGNVLDQASEANKQLLGLDPKLLAVPSFEGTLGIEGSPNKLKQQTKVDLKDPWVSKLAEINAARRKNVDVSGTVGEYRNALTQFLGSGQSKLTMASLAKINQMLKIHDKPITLAPEPSLKVAGPKTMKKLGPAKLGARAAKVIAPTQGPDLTAQLESLRPTQRERPQQGKFQSFLQSLGSAKLNPNDSFGANLLQLGLASLRGKASQRKEKEKKEDLFDRRMDEFNKLKVLQLIKSKEIGESRRISAEQFSQTREDRALTRGATASRHAENLRERRSARVSKIDKPIMTPHIYQVLSTGPEAAEVGKLEAKLLPALRLEMRGATPAALKNALQRRVVESYDKFNEKAYDSALAIVKKQFKIK